MKRLKRPKRLKRQKRLKRHILAIIALLTVFILPAAGVKTGIEVLRDEGFAQLRGKRVGLLTNPTGVDSDLNATIDILHGADGVTVVALFSPEHGVRGDIAAGASVAGQTDAVTGLKVYSLYGATRRPSPEMLRGIDVMVYDLQDIGCRSYTFISTLGNAMGACADAGIEFLVLDRPNPLGGERIEGSAVVDPDCRSFVSQYPIPYIYGLTCAELARWINREILGGKCRLSVVRMEGWKRSMTFADTGLPWVPTSPNIPTAETALYYPATGILGELGSVSIGANFTMPFRVVVGEGVDAPTLSRRLNSSAPAGVRFRPCYLRPGGKKQQGVQIYFTDLAAASLTEVQFHIIGVLKSMGVDPFAVAQSRLGMFDKVCGRKSIRRALASGRSDEALALWRADEAAWRDSIAPLLLY